MANERKDVDWLAVRTDYESGRASLRQIASTHGISKTALIERRNKEKWVKKTNSDRPSNTQEVIQPDMNAALRASLGFKLRYEQHKTWDEVATAAGYASRGAARNAVKREASRHISQDISEIREEEFYRLGRLQAKCYEAATDDNNEGWTWAIDRYVSLSKRISELMGSDVQVKSEATTNQIIIREVPVGLLPEPTV